MPFDPTVEIQGIRRRKYPPRGDWATWGNPPTIEEWRQAQQEAGESRPDDKENE